MQRKSRAIEQCSNGADTGEAQQGRKARPDEKRPGSHQQQGGHVQRDVDVLPVPRFTPSLALGRCLRGAGVGRLLAAVVVPSPSHASAAPLLNDSLTAGLVRPADCSLAMASVQPCN